MLQPAHSTRLFTTQVRRSEGAVRRRLSHAVGTLNPSITVDILRTDFKYPCVRVEKEIGPAGPGPRPVAMIATQLIVKLRNGVNQSMLSELLNGMGIGSNARKLLSPDTYLVDLPVTCMGNTATVMALPLAMSRFQGRAIVENVQPNYLYFTQAEPDDPDFPKLWGLQNTGLNGLLKGADVHAVEGWEFAHDSPDVVVAILDTGIDDSHEDLASNMWANAGEMKKIAGSDDDGNGFVDDVRGWDFYSNDSDPEDSDWHGTHVAGVLGAVGNNTVGVTGATWSVRLMTLRFMESWGGATSDASNGVRYATAMHANIISNSWGGGAYDDVLRTSIENAGSSGILFVAAAGNDGMDNDLSPFYPATYDLANIISVAATNDFDQLAPFSDYGAQSVDIAAPGVGIYSTRPNNAYGYATGTSVAAPFLSGACALAWTINRSASAPEIRDMLLISADPDTGGTLSMKCQSGGRLNLLKLLRPRGAG